MSDLFGYLGRLPLELLWNTLDELVTDSSKLSHEAFCSIRQLGHTNKQAAATIDAWFHKNSSIGLIRQAIEADGCFTHINALELRQNSPDTFMASPLGAPLDFVNDNLACGLVTGIIKDNCVGCFKKIREYAPVLDGTYVTNRGWLFLGIAASSASLDMIKYFCSIESPASGTHLLELLTRPANVLYNNFNSRSVLQKIALHPDKQFARDLFDFLVPVYRQISTLAIGESAKNKLLLCEFLTPQQAVEFEKVDCPLYDVTDPDSSRNAYHSAATNSPDFLEYLRQKSVLSMQERHGNVRGGALPIHQAIIANRFDCFIWLQHNGGADSYQAYLRPWTTGTTADLAARLTTDESADMLVEILGGFVPGENYLDPFFCLGFLGSLLDGLRSHDYSNIRGLTTQELKDLKKKDEKRAIKKAKIIVAFAEGSRDVPGLEDGWKRAVSKAQKLGFDKLAAVIQKASPCN